ncbi:MAG: hypothetical protein V3T70_02155 [Phycisphaerae bacterium]
MARDDLAGVPDGGTLRRLASGLEVVRRRKHEPIAHEQLQSAGLEHLTDKRHGSKFAPDWTLQRLTEWITSEIEARQWSIGTAQDADVHFKNPVGYFLGKSVKTIRIISDGRFVHAFPIEDQR